MSVGITMGGLAYKKRIIIYQLAKYFDTSTPVITEMGRVTV